MHALPHPGTIVEPIGQWGATKNNALPLVPNVLSTELLAYLDAGSGFGSDSLSVKELAQCSPEGIEAGTAVTWCAPFAQFRGRVPFYQQTGLASSPHGGGTIGSLVDILMPAVGDGVQILELYPQEFEVAYGPSNPYSMAYRQALASTAAVLGIP